MTFIEKQKAQAMLKNQQTNGHVVRPMASPTLPIPTGPRILSTQPAVGRNAGNVQSGTLRNDAPGHAQQEPPKHDSPNVSVILAESQRFKEALEKSEKDNNRLKAQLRDVPKHGPSNTSSVVAKNERSNTALETALEKSQKEAQYLRVQLNDVRMQDAGLGSMHRRPGTLFSGLFDGAKSCAEVVTGPGGLGPSRHAGPPPDERIRKSYNEALKSAGLDFKACNSCGITFHSQFRGAPEDHGNILKLKCTSCDAECHRWQL